MAARIQPLMRKQFLMLETQMEIQICNVAIAQNQYVKKKFNVFSTAPSCYEIPDEFFKYFLKSSNFIFNCNKCDNKKDNVNEANN